MENKAYERRLLTTLRHLNPEQQNNSANSASPHDYKFNNRVQKWNGWGFADSVFDLNDKGNVELSGNRYLFSGREFPDLRKWCEEELGIDVTMTTKVQENMERIKEPIVNEEFLRAIKDCYKSLSFDGYCRVYHSHGHTVEEMFQLRESHIPRLVDVVIFPSQHSDVEKIVEAATKYDVVVMPYGGGTSVTNSLAPPVGEKRMIVCLDMKEMRRVKWIDRESMMACIEAGAVGIELDEELKKEGFTLGHEPDSFEFSTLGGWVATNASGMKKNVYGNIEDMLVSVTLVTPSGTYQRSSPFPRVSTGPDLNRVVIGSEGTLGVVTEAIMRIRPLPQVREYGSIVFPDFESGVKFMRECTRKQCLPASIRLVDNAQFQMGRVLKPGGEGKFAAFMDYVKKIYVTKIKGFEPTEMCACTLLFEGTNKLVASQSSTVYAIADKYGGLKGGEENGKRGYFLTYMIAYIRDFGMKYYYIGESFETSVPWANVQQLIRNTKARVVSACEEKGIIHPPFVSSRVTQCYETGAAVYFYFGFCFRGIEDPVACYMQIEDEARDEILANGGSLSHHHGIGKIRKKWVSEVVSETGVKMLQGLKRELDPKNIMGNNNIIDFPDSGSNETE